MNKTLRICMLLAVTLGVSLGLNSVRAQRVKTKDVMKFKLHYAQQVLEGITTENFTLLATNAIQLRRLSQAAEWDMPQAEDYQRFTIDFQRSAKNLERAAMKKNVDAATVAYFQLTVSCVNCHRYLRESRLVGRPLPMPHLATITPRRSRP